MAHSCETVDVYFASTFRPPDPTDFTAPTFRKHAFIIMDGMVYMVLACVHLFQISCGWHTFCLPSFPTPRRGPPPNQLPHLALDSPTGITGPVGLSEAKSGADIFRQTRPGSKYSLAFTLLPWTQLKSPISLIKFMGDAILFEETHVL